MSFDPNHPPRNRAAEALPILEIRIEHEGGHLRFDPNSIIRQTVESERYPGLGEPKATSVLSGRPAYVYRSDDLEIPLTLGEIRRLTLHRLEPEEFMILRDRFGIFFEIHDDFYDVDTGEALQPVDVEVEEPAAPLPRETSTVPRPR